LADDPADRLVLPNAFVSAAEDALYAGSFLTRPSLWTVQAIAILSLCGHNVCDSDLLSSLLAVGIKTAQSLGLHSLGRRSRAIEKKQNQGVDLSGHMDVAEVVDVEMGKRVWWALVLEDWFAIPFRGVWGKHDIRTYVFSLMIQLYIQIRWTPPCRSIAIAKICRSAATCLEAMAWSRLPSKSKLKTTGQADPQEASLLITGRVNTSASLSRTSFPKFRVSQAARPSAHLLVRYVS
jgi:hypothetical protein